MPHLFQDAVGVVIKSFLDSLVELLSDTGLEVALAILNHLRNRDSFDHVVHPAAAGAAAVSRTLKWYVRCSIRSLCSGSLQHWRGGRAGARPLSGKVAAYVFTLALSYLLYPANRCTLATPNGGLDGVCARLRLIW